MTTPETLASVASDKRLGPEDLLSQDAGPVTESPGTGGSRLAAAQAWLHERTDSGLGRLVLLAYVLIVVTISMVCAVFAPVWAEWRQGETDRKG